VAPANDRAPRPNGSSAAQGPGRLPRERCGPRGPAGGLEATFSHPMISWRTAGVGDPTTQRRDDGRIESTLEIPPDGAATSVPGLRFASKARRLIMG